MKLTHGFFHTRFLTVPCFSALLLSLSMTAACDDSDDELGSDTGSDSGNGDGDGDDSLSFESDILPLISDRCGCHRSGNSPGNLGLDSATAYGNLVGRNATQAPMKRVEANSAENSYLPYKLKDTQASVGGSGAVMPKGQGAPRLSPEEIALVETWINEGALP